MRRRDFLGTVGGAAATWPIAAYAQQTDRVLDGLYDKQSGELDRKKRYAVLREFEKHALEQAYTIPTIWWHRIIVSHRQMKGWQITPSHYVGQDLAEVWLDQ